jgi:predicted CopG family antitoxin
MSKNVMLSDEAYNALRKHKKNGESFSDVVKRLAPAPIETFGDLENYLQQLEGPLFSDLDALRRLRARKRKLNAD